MARIFADCKKTIEGGRKIQATKILTTKFTKSTKQSARGRHEDKRRVRRVTESEKERDAMRKPRKTPAKRRAPS